MSGELNTPAKYEAHRLQLAQKIWTELKANDSAECRSCHTPSAMALCEAAAEAAERAPSLAKSGMTCIDCHTGRCAHAASGQIERLGATGGAARRALLRTPAEIAAEDARDFARS